MYAHWLPLLSVRQGEERECGLEVARHRCKSLTVGAAQTGGLQVERNQ